MDDVTRGRLLVAAQTLCEVGLVGPGRRRWSRGPVLDATAGTLGLAGLGLGAAGATRLGRRLRAHPDLPDDAVLRTDGVYAHLRHPIYAGLLSGAVGVALVRARPVSWVALAGLVVVLSAKATREESALAARFGPAYEMYRAVTPRWPGVR